MDELSQHLLEFGIISFTTPEQNESVISILEHGPGSVVFEGVLDPGVFSDHYLEDVRLLPEGRGKGIDVRGSL